MKRILVVITLLLSLGSIAQAQAPSPNANANVSWITVCSWDTNPACILYQVVNGMIRTWK